MKDNQRGSGHLVIILTMVILALGAIGYFVFQKTQTEDGVAETATKTSEASSTNEHSSNGDKYVLIDDWGVKFPAPTDGVNILWAFSDDTDGKTIGFSTSRMTNTEICNASNGATGGLFRQTSKIKVEESVGTTITALNDTPINTYYYGFARPNGSNCDNTTPSDVDEAIMIETLAKSIEAI